MYLWLKDKINEKDIIVMFYNLWMSKSMQSIQRKVSYTNRMWNNRKKVYGDVENWVAVGCGSKYCCSHYGLFNNYNCSLCPNQGNK